MAYGTHKTEGRRTRERRLVRRALVFYGLLFVGCYLIDCLQNWRIDLALGVYSLALALLATAFHALAGIDAPDVAFWRKRRAAKP